MKDTVALVYAESFFVSEELLLLSKNGNDEVSRVTEHDDEHNKRMTNNEGSVVRSAESGKAPGMKAF